MCDRHVVKTNKIIRGENVSNNIINELQHEDLKKKILKDTDLFVLDMDGTFYLGDRLIEGSLDFLVLA